MNTPHLPTVSGFLLGGSVPPEVLEDALASGRLVRLARIGDVEVYRDPAAVPVDYIVEDYLPTALALAGGSLHSAETPPFILADASALHVAGCGVLLPSEIEIVTASPAAGPAEGVPGTHVVGTGFAPGDWSWDRGLPVMTPRKALQRLSEDPGVEPQWLADAAGDVITDGRATFAEVADAVDARAVSWGWADGAAFLAELAGVDGVDGGDL